MKKFYLLPLRVSFLLCLFFSSAFVFGQEVLETKSSLQQSNVQPRLLNLKDSALAGLHRKKDFDESNMKNNEVGSGVKLKVASSNSEQTEELRKKNAAKTNKPKDKTSMNVEKLQSKQYENSWKLNQIPIRENSSK